MYERNGDEVVIYFDNSSTTKPYQEVLDAFVTASTKYFGNPSSIHKLGGQAERLLTQSRSAVSKLLGVKPHEIIFTSGGTEGNNLAIKGTALKHFSRGKHIITSSIEHASVLATCRQLEEFGFEVTYLPVNQSGVVSLADLEKALRPDTILVSLIHVNNEVGSVQPIEEIGKVLKDYPKVQFHVDYVQGIGKVPLSLEYVDLCTISGHKFHSVKGTGLLYKREGVTIAPILTGGQQERHLRSGTENLPGIVAMAKALRMTLENSHEKQIALNSLRDELRDFFAGIAQVHINSPEGGAPHILNISCVGLKPEVIVHAFAEQEIYVSTKSACSSKQKDASHVLEQMGFSNDITESAIRISLSEQNTKEEVEIFKRTVKGILANLYQVV